MKSLQNMQRIGAILVLVVALAWPAGASDGLKGFEPSGEFDIELGGQPLADAKLYQSQQSSSYLILAPSLKSPLLMNLRGRVAQAVSFMKVSKNDDGSIDLLPGAAHETLGQIKPSGTTVSFDVKGQKMVLTAKPALVGNQNEKSLAEHNPGYAYKAAKYRVNTSQIAKLKNEGRDVKVKVFFGSWCGVCSRLVPKIMKVSEALEGSKVDFEYYGLPRMMTDDPVTEEMKIRGVPTGVVYVDGKEVGRLTGRELAKPEAGIEKVLGGA